MTSTAEADEIAAQENTEQSVGEASSQRTWVQPLSDLINTSNRTAEARLRTPLTCYNKSDAPVLYLPPEEAQVHGRSTRYIRKFARQNGFRLGKDRRSRNVQPISEQRDQKPPMIALGLSLLLKQTGLPGAARTLSKPHALAPDGDLIQLGELIRMAAFATPLAKRVVVLPNRILVNTLQNTQPICGYACKLRHEGKSTLLSHFDSPYFRAIGYSTSNQYVVHICLGGGPRQNSSLWTQIPTLTSSEFNFQLFPGSKPEDDFGLFYITFYLDLEAAPKPWWLQDMAPQDSQEQVDTHEPAVASNDSSVHRKAS